MPRPVDEPLQGALIAGKYRTTRVIGRGAMGVVYEAWHAELGKRVAIKVIESALAQNDEFLERFRREARAGSAVDSESIVKVFDAGVDREAGAYMVMEYLEGENLEQRLSRAPRLEVRETVRIAQQIGNALARAHGAGIVHRDLKPANVFLTRREDGSPVAKVLDFGISLILAPDASGDVALRLTQVGMVVGSPQYSSPEQVQGKDDVDHRTDVWSLGVVVYEMLAGRRAYAEKDNYEDFVQMLLQEEPAPLVSVAPWVPAPVAAVVHAAIRHDPAQRLPDCGTFARLLGQAGATATAPEGEEDLTIVTSGAPMYEHTPPSGTIVMKRPAFEAEDHPPDSDDSPTNPRPEARAAPKMPERPQPEPPDMGGFLLPVPPPRAQQPTLPSVARTERARRRARLKLAIVALAVVVLVGGGATAFLLFYGGR